MDARDDKGGIELATLLEVDLGVPLGQLRAVPVGVGDEERLLLVHAADAEVDPYMNMFFYPEDTLTFTLVTLDGDVCWEHDCGRGVVPGIWFCPVYPFDLDGDGVEEVWFVDNVDDEHPFSLDGYRLARIDPRSGAVTGRWAWPVPEPQTMSHRYRNFVLGGHVGDEPVLVTAQGTYGPMHLQGWEWDPDAGVEPRWTFDVAADDPGARGSHMTPVLDVDGDGTDELLWGERAVELDRGTELFCADRDRWDGHSDVVQPTRHAETGEWYVYTARESSPEQSPRVATFDATGRRVWSALEEGHVDMGWTARIGEDGRHVALAVRIDAKRAGRSGFGRDGVEEFHYDAYTGEPRRQSFPLYGSVPVDLDGDGRHELVYGGPRGSEASGDVRDPDGTVVGTVDGTVAMASKFLPRPGEQVLTYLPDGRVTVHGDANATDGSVARERYETDYYGAARRLTAVGYNWVNLGGV